MFDSLDNAIERVSPGKWGVGVSGGADSVALLSLLRRRGNLSLHVIHLDHQTRGPESTADAEFVRQLALSWNLPITIARRAEIESTRKTWPSNPSARFRAMRLQLFRNVIEAQHLKGVLLAHHADDQAETVLHRLLRGSSLAGLTGMRFETQLTGLKLVRPLLKIRREMLRDYLRQIGQRWREDASNQSPKYFRNRLRQLLQSRQKLVEAIIDASRSFETLRDWAKSNAATLEPSFNVRELQVLPLVLAEESARQWLEARGVPPAELSQGVVGSLLEMATDVASPSRRDFSGNISVRRRQRRISVA
jgi:tRNA(Ile)-lysidine synthetase-like protein